MWAQILLTFGTSFWLVLRRHDDSQSGVASVRHVATGPVTVTTAVGPKGNIGVYLEAISTVTPGRQVSKKPLKTDTSIEK
jgi:hypothetical protein